jgi:hypothetical protein
MTEPSSSAFDAAATFLDLSRRKLQVEFWPRMESAVGRLSDEQIWWRPNQHCNSIGHLLLHLDGNLRQWILSVLGGAPDVRNREQEFHAVEQPDGAELLRRLRTTLDEVTGFLAQFPAERLGTAYRHPIFGREVDAMAAIYQVVEHFSMHLGQILYLAKEQLDVDLGFFAGSASKSK